MNKGCCFYWGLLCWLGIMSHQLQAQVRIAEKRTNRVKIIGDTSSVYYCTLSNPTQYDRLNDGLRNFENIDMTWGDPVHYISLGNLLAAPSFDLVYQSPTWNGGFRVGFNQFERYRLNKEDIRYYRITGNRPFTDLYYSQINQKNNFIRAEFGHKFSDQVYLGIQYSLANQTGFYKNQRVRNQNIGVTLRAFSKNRRYHGYFNFLTNAAKHENNGGVTKDTVIGFLDDALEKVPTISETARTQHNRTGIYYSQMLYNKPIDSLAAYTQASREWRHDISYQFHRYKFFDKGPPKDSSLYGIASVNPRGIRSLVRHQLLENTVSVRQALGGTLTSAPLWVKIYLRHQWHNVFQEPVRFNENNFTIGTIVQNNPQFRLRYRLNGQATWAAQRLDFFVRGRLGYDLKILGYLEVETNFQRYQASLIDRQLYASWDLVWDNTVDFRQIQVFNFGGSYTYRLKTRPVGILLKGTLLNHTLTNWVYYDAEARQSLQAPTSINLLQLQAKGNFRLGTFHLDNEIIWQPILVGEEYFRVPELILQHNLYWQDWLFKRAMLAKIGVRFYYHTDYFPYGYTPLTGSFFVQNKTLLSLYPRFDAYVGFRIWQFRFFIRGENLGYFVYKRNYQTAYRHPITNFVVRVGIGWRLFD